MSLATACGAVKISRRTIFHGNITKKAPCQLALRSFNSTKCVFASTSDFRGVDDHQSFRYQGSQKNFSTSNPLQGEEALDWVPTAYRGVDSFKRTDRRTERPTTDRRNHRKSNTASSQGKRQLSPKLARIKRKDMAIQKAQQIEIETDLDRLCSLSAEMQRILSSYHGILISSEPNVQDGGVKLKLLAQYPAAAQNKRILNFSKWISDEVETIGKLDDIPSTSLAESDDLFRGLCRILQDFIQSCCKVYNHESQMEVYNLIECATTCLNTLKALRTHRASLFERLEQKAAQEDLSENSSWKSPLSVVASYISESFTKITHHNERDSAQTGRITLAHEDDDLGPTLPLVRIVVESITAAAVSNKITLDEPEKKLVALLNVLPEGVTPESRMLLSILEILCHTGTLESAQECRRIFEKYSPDLPHLPFSMVLRCYLEASRNETINERKHEIVEETLSIFKSRWSHSLPRHKVERVAQASSVLDCIAVSGAAKDRALLKQAEIVFRRSLGDSTHAQVLKAMATANGKVDNSAVPLINYLARVYATSGDARRVKRAKLMVENILPRDSEKEDSGRNIKYPNIETINTLLDGILKLHQEGNPDLDVPADLAFSQRLLDFSMSRRESKIWPNETTFELMMDLYTILKPENVGTLMEELVSKYETRAYFSQTNSMTISLATYNRVIWGLWEEAKHENPRQTSQRALALLEKLEMLSTPFLLTKKQVREMMNIELYNFDLRPTAKTYELVLNVCADTAAPTEYEVAAKVALVTGSRLLQIGQGQRKAAEKLKSCLDRIPSDSMIRNSINELLLNLDQATEGSESDGKDDP